MPKDEKLDSVSDGGIREDEKLDSVSGGGIRKYESLVRDLLQQNCPESQIKEELIKAKKSICETYPEWFPTKSLDTGYDWVKYEINAIDIVINRLDNGEYPRKSW